MRRNASAAIPVNASPTFASRVAVAGVVALALLELLWEMVLAPLGPRGSWLALKALPLAVLAPGLMRGARRARQWLALLLPLYMAEALARAISESGRHAVVAAAAFIVASVAFVALLGWFRTESLRQRKHDPLDGT